MLENGKVPTINAEPLVADISIEYCAAANGNIFSKSIIAGFNIVHLHASKRLYGNVNRKAVLAHKINPVVRISYADFFHCLSEFNGMFQFHRF